MDGRSLQNKIQFGMGVAGRRLGSPFIVYRPRTASSPLASGNRVIKLYASFNAQDETYRRVDGYGEAVWFGVYDSSYTQPGDYLVGNTDTFFVSAQRPALPVQCVLTNSVVSVTRPQPPMTGGYGGFVADAAAFVLTDWPCSLLQSSTHGGSGQVREVRFTSWTLLLPALPVAVKIADVVIDGQGRTFVVGAAEQSALGWRLLVKQIAAG